jgi:hypothetical protein
MMRRPRQALALTLLLASLGLQSGCHPAAPPAAAPMALPTASPGTSASASAPPDLLKNQRAALEKAGKVEAIGLQHDADQRRAIDDASR